MISLGKILFTIAAIIGVWATFRALVRWKSGERRPTPAQRAAEAARETVRSRTAPLTDLVKCPRCGAYHESATPCSCQANDGPRA